MATETLSPDVLLLQTNLTGSVTDIQDDPDSPDALWLTDASGTHDVDTVCHVSFPTPAGDLSAGADLQEFRILWRGSNGANTPDIVRVDLYENGSLVTSSIYSLSNPPGTAVVISATWNAADLTSIDGSNVECYVYTTADTSPAQQVATGEIGAIEWNVDYISGTVQTITDTDYIPSGNTLHLPELLKSFTIPDIDYIASGNSQFEPSVTFPGSVNEWKPINSWIDDGNIKRILDYIVSGNALFDTNVVINFTIPDVDYIASSNVLYDPDVKAADIIDCGYIPSGNNIHEPELVWRIFDDFSGDIAKWSEEIGSGFSINASNQLVPATVEESVDLSALIYTAYKETNVEQWAKIKLGINFATRFYGLALRVSNLGNISFYRIIVTNTNTNIGRVVDKTTIVGITGFTNISWTEGDVLGACVEGAGLTTRFRIWKNPIGATPDDWGVPDNVYVISDIGNATSDTGDYVGVSNWNIANVVGAYLDDFSGGSFTASQVVTDVDYITSSNLLYDPDVGIKPKVLSGLVSSPRLEGDIVELSQCYVIWTDNTISGANEGDTPDGLVFTYTGSYTTTLTGVLSDVSAGTYSIQFSGTNQYGTTLSNAYEFIVNDRIECDFISSTSQLFLPSVDHDTSSQTINDLDFVSSSIVLHQPDVLPQEFVITDVDYIVTSSIVYDPDVGIKPVNYDYTIITPRVEGDTVVIAECLIAFNNTESADVINVGDIPDGLSFATIGSGNVAAYWQGDLSGVSSGTYALQAQATNQYGTTISIEYEFVVKDRIQCDFISSTLLIYNPAVDHDTSSQTIDDTDYIASGNALYTPDLLGTLVITDVDYIVSGNSLFDPTFIGSITTDADYISATNQIFNPNIGRAPTFNVFGIQNPVFEETFHNNTIRCEWYLPITGGAHIGETPPNLENVTDSINGFTKLDGFIANGSAGTYNLQWSATNDFGTTLSPITELVVQKRLSCDYVAPSSNVYTPNVIELVENQINADFILSSLVIHEPSVNAGAVSLDIDYISTGNVLYDPQSVISSYAISIEYIASTSTLYTPSINSGSALLEIDFISSSSQLHEPSFGNAYQIDVDYINPINLLFDPIIYSELIDYINCDFIVSSSQIFDPQLNPGLFSISTDYISSSASVYNPYLGDQGLPYDLISFYLYVDLNVDKSLYVDKIVEHDLILTTSFQTDREL